MKKNYFIYIAGRITGEPLLTCKVKFAKIEEGLRSLGLSPINPFKIGCQDHWTFTQCKPHNFKAIRQCQAIFLLDDYIDSPGARAELKFAKQLKLTQYYQAADDYYQLVEELKLETIHKQSLIQYFQ